jgi:hypothetical protein
MTFQATPLEAFSAIQEAARRTGLLFLTGDAQAGTAVFTAGRYLMLFGEKVHVRITPTASGTVQVSVSSGVGLGVIPSSGRTGATADRVCEALSQILPRSG